MSFHTTASCPKKCSISVQFTILHWLYERTVDGPNTALVDTHVYDIYHIWLIYAKLHWWYITIPPPLWNWKVLSFMVWPDVGYDPQVPGLLDTMLSSTVRQRRLRDQGWMYSFLQWNSFTKGNLTNQVKMSDHDISSLCAVWCVLTGLTPFQSMPWCMHLTVLQFGLRWALTVLTVDSCWTIWTDRSEKCQTAKKNQWTSTHCSCTVLFFPLQIHTYRASVPKAKGPTTNYIQYTN